jgi:signal transduction histidine kinase
MLIPLWRGGSIAWRFVATVAMVVTVTLGALGLFLTFGGVWAQPPLRQLGFFEAQFAILHMIEAAPPDLRAALADAARPAKFDVTWIPAGAPAARILDDLDQGLQNVEPVRRLAELFQPDYRLRVFGPDTSRVAPPRLPDGTPVVPSGYCLAIGLSDGSWLIDHAKQRFWGLEPPLLWSAWLIVLVLSTTIISLLAARQLVKPIRQFAEAIQLFGTNPKAAPMDEVGPSEFRGVIAAFNVMQDRIQKLMGYRTAMLAAISHDLRTPLTRIRLRGEFIQDPVQQERLFRDVDELQQMVDGALAFFRGDAQEERITALNLPSIVETIVDDFADQGIVIHYSGPARLPFLGRPLALRRAIANVIENAVKYATPPEVGLTIDETQVTITVRDGGPGIPETALELVFNPFYRLEGSRNRATGGVGLGLTAARSIVREHGGEVILANRPEGGLEARITLARPSEAMIQTNRAAGEPAARGRDQNV